MSDTYDNSSEPLEVIVERHRVWIKRGCQSFMMAYDDTENMEWYAGQLRKVLQIVDMNSLRTPLERNGGNVYRPHLLMTASGEFWRCKHGNSGYDGDLNWVGCSECAKVMEPKWGGLDAELLDALREADVDPSSATGLDLLPRLRTLLRRVREFVHHPVEETAVLTGIQRIENPTPEQRSQGMHNAAMGWAGVMEQQGHESLGKFLRKVAEDYEKGILPENKQ